MTDVLFDILDGPNGAIGLIALNRPTALNALTHGMIIAISQQLKEWQNDDDIKMIIIRSLSEKAFCAGGDIRQIYEKGQQGDLSVSDFFWDEYRLNWQIANCSKPYLALMNGITMGGGCGVSVYASHRVATENLLLAMPETGIGFFPDIGASYFLGLLPKPLGHYLSLTGSKIDVNAAIELGLVDYHIEQTQYDALIEDLKTIQWNENPHLLVSEVLDRYHQPTTLSNLSKETPLINTYFNHVTLSEVYEQLTSATDEWAQKTLTTLNTKSPLSLLVTWEELNRGKSFASLDKSLKMEFCLVQNFLRDSDAYTGIKAVVIDKNSRPQWKHKSIVDVHATEVFNFFELPKDGKNLEL